MIGREKIEKIMDAECPDCKFEKMMDEIQKKNEEEFKNIPEDLLHSEKVTQDWVEGGFDINSSVDYHVVGSKNDADKSEEIADYIGIFNTNKGKYSKHFRQDWTQIGLSIEDYKVFRNAVVREMYLDKQVRNSGNALRLKKSVHNYLKKRGLLESPDSLETDDLKNAEPLFDEKKIEQILQVNKQIFYEMMSDISSANPDRPEATYFFKRGLCTNKEIDVATYKEKYTINSYTLSNSIADMFSDGIKKIPSIRRVPVSYLENAILFNSFVFPPATKERQYEFGVIPYPNQQTLIDKGTFRRNKIKDVPIHEYELEVIPL